MPKSKGVVTSYYTVTMEVIVVARDMESAEQIVYDALDAAEQQTDGSEIVDVWETLDVGKASEWGKPAVRRRDTTFDEVL